jgi:hypothetical protein
MPCWLRECLGDITSFCETRICHCLKVLSAISSKNYYDAHHFFDSCKSEISISALKSASVGDGAPCETSLDGKGWQTSGHQNEGHTLTATLARPFEAIAPSLCVSAPYYVVIK